jgi:monothiol glutaredoxin
MKGTPAMPQCGFSARAAQILSSFNVPYHAVNILADPEKRQSIKDFSNWPTLPQIYVNGEFIGGSDILLEMYQNGELKELITKAFA